MEVIDSYSLMQTCLIHVQIYKDSGKWYEGGILRVSEEELKDIQDRLLKGENVALELAKHWVTGADEFDIAVDLLNSPIKSSYFINHLSKKVNRDKPKKPYQRIGA